MARDPPRLELRSAHLPAAFSSRSLREIWQEQDFQELWRLRGVKPEDVGKI